MITNSALKNGFTGGLIVDFPNSKKAKKFFLFLMAGYSDEIVQDAEKAIMLPTARTHGEGYSEDESMEVSDNESDESSESEEAKGPQVDVKGRKSKVVQKLRKGIGRFKANGNRKSKSWILKKKDRMRRQGTKVKSDSKYSGRRRPVAYS